MLMAGAIDSREVTMNSSSFNCVKGAVDFLSIKVYTVSIIMKKKKGN